MFGGEGQGAQQVGRCFGVVDCRSFSLRPRMFCCWFLQDGFNWLSEDPGLKHRVLGRSVTGCQCASFVIWCTSAKCLEEQLGGLEAAFNLGTRAPGTSSDRDHMSEVPILKPFCHEPHEHGIMGAIFS